VEQELVPPLHMVVPLILVIVDQETVTQFVHLTVIVLLTMVVHPLQLVC
jgi:hypothetical protein